MNSLKLLLVSLCYLVINIQIVASESIRLIELYLDSGDIELQINNRPEQAMRYALWAQELYDNNDINNLGLEERIHLNLASVFDHIDNREYAIKHLTKLLRVKEKRGDWGPEYIRYAGSLAGHYIKVNSDSAFTYYRLALLYCRKNKDSIAVASAYNNLGMFRAGDALWKEAFSYYLRAIEVLKKSAEMDSLLLVSITDNISEYYLNNGDTLRAIDCIEDNLTYLITKEPIHPHYYKRTLRYALKLCKIYLTRGEWNKVERIINQLNRQLEVEDIEWKVENSLRLKELQLLIAKREKNAEKIGMYSKELTDLGLQHLEIIEKKNELLTSALKDYKQISVNQEIEKIKEKVKDQELDKQLKINYSIVISILSIMIVAILLVNYKNRARSRINKSTSSSEEEAKKKAD